MRLIPDACYHGGVVQRGGADESRPLGKGGSQLTDETRERSFDELARALASGNVSRRKALKWMGGALLGGVLASIPGVAWAAPPEDRGRPCPKGAIKCRDACCSSPEDLCCRGVCTHVVFDRFNCGRCGNECAEGEGCCGERCVPLNTNQNCGGCNSACLVTEQCVIDQCQPANGT